MTESSAIGITLPPSILIKMDKSYEITVFRHQLVGSTGLPFVKEDKYIRWVPHSPVSLPKGNFQNCYAGKWNPSRELTFCQTEETDSNVSGICKTEYSEERATKKGVPEICTAVPLNFLAKSKTAHRQSKIPQDSHRALRVNRNFIGSTVLERHQISEPEQRDIGENPRHSVETQKGHSLGMRTRRKDKIGPP